MEARYFQVGGLHRDALGWMAGLPLWFALWRVLGAWTWAELAPRLRSAPE